MASRKTVADAMTNRLVSTGWNVSTATEFQVVYEIDAKGAAGFLSSLFYGHATQPIYRLTAQLLEQGESAKVIAGLELISNPGTNRTTRTAMNSGKGRSQVQDLLESLKLEIEQAPRDTSR